jgi:hypothetical protein
MIHLILQVAGLLAVLAILMSFVEHQAHRHIMHRKHSLSGRIPALRRTFEHHAVQHHGQYRKIFCDEPLPPGADRGLRLNLKEGFVEALPFALVLALFSLTAAILFPFVVCGHHYLWNRIHLEMHKPEQRHFADWRLYKFLARHHYLHHQHPDKNFNVVLPFADYVLGTHAQATDADKLGMSAAVGVARENTPANENARRLKARTTRNDLKSLRPNSGVHRHRVVHDRVPQNCHRHCLFPSGALH